MRIGVVGGGVVGQATARSYLEHVEEVPVYDVLPERRTHSLVEVLECDLTFVCLPTPQRKGGLECDTDALVEFFEGLADQDVYPDRLNLVLRSTVPIGFTRRTRDVCNLPNLVHSPEFLTARCALVDAQMPARNIIGVPGTGVTGEEPWCTSRCYFTLEALYRKRWPHVPIHLMTSDESEATKLFQNSFFSVKVAYWNEVRTLADELGLDWQRVMEAILADGRIHPSHTQVPGPDGRFGWGGSCLPKDIASLIHQMQRLCHGDGGKVSGPLPTVCVAAHHRNRRDRQREVK